MNPGPGEAGVPPGAFHLPVMVDEVVRGLSVADGGTYLDGTLGEGGHSLAILESGSGDGATKEALGDPIIVIGIDLDGRSVEAAARRLSRFGSRFLPLQGNYADMASLAARRGVQQVDGVLLDLGFSSRQVDRPGYGLSFQSDEPLDMRYDGAQPLSAADLVNTARETELVELFRRFGEEPRARAIANAIVRERTEHPISSTRELAALVERIAGGRRGHRIHPATRIFQALRIAVNAELENLQAGLEAAVSLLRPEGRLAVISYHSLEDRIVKNFLTHNSADCVCPPGLPECVCGQEPALAIVNRRIIRPSGEEIAFNPRSRSARLRLARRIQSGR
jgi:16S rRNA (cytosine1402-N4)-methyltransferase